MDLDFDQIGQHSMDEDFDADNQIPSAHSFGANVFVRMQEQQ